MAEEEPADEDALAVDDDAVAGEDVLPLEAAPIDVPLLEAPVDVPVVDVPAVGWPVDEALPVVPTEALALDAEWELGCPLVPMLEEAAAEAAVVEAVVEPEVELELEAPAAELATDECVVVELDALECPEDPLHADVSSPTVATASR